MLDTHALIWWVSEPARLSRRAAKAIAASAASDGVVASAISVFEIGTLLRRERLRLNVDAGVWFSALLKLPELSFEPASADVAQQAAAFPASFPGDPADRLIAATARVLGTRLVTADRRLSETTLVDTLW